MRRCAPVPSGGGGHTELRGLHHEGLQDAVHPALHRDGLCEADGWGQPLLVKRHCGGGGWRLAAGGSPAGKDFTGRGRTNRPRPMFVRHRATSTTRQGSFSAGQRGGLNGAIWG